MKWLFLLTSLLLASCIIPDDEIAETFDLQDELVAAGVGLAETTWEEGEGMEAEAFDHKCGNANVIPTGTPSLLYTNYVCWSADYARISNVPNQQVCVDRCLRRSDFRGNPKKFVEYNAGTKQCDCDKANQAQDTAQKCRKGGRRNGWNTYRVDRVTGSPCGRNRCCSRWNWCGSGTAYCNTGNHERSDHRCGPSYGGAICNGLRCCSRWSWCGGSRNGSYDAWCQSKLQFLNHVAGFADNSEDVSIVLTTGFAAIIAIPALVGFKLYKKRQEASEEYETLLNEV